MEPVIAQIASKARFTICGRPTPNFFRPEKNKS
jgi:hypothetical protein